MDRLARHSPGRLPGRETSERSAFGGNEPDRLFTEVCTSLQGGDRKILPRFSNEILWPLFHDLFSHCNFDPMYWETYQRVNRKFAEHVMEHTRKGDYLWVHDYQLILVARELRRLGLDRQIGFFLHIPFPLSTSS